MKDLVPFAHCMIKFLFYFYFMLVLVIQKTILTTCLHFEGVVLSHQPAREM